MFVFINHYSPLMNCITFRRLQRNAYASTSIWRNHSHFARNDNTITIKDMLFCWFISLGFSFAAVFCFCFLLLFAVFCFCLVFGVWCLVFGVCCLLFAVLVCLFACLFACLLVCPCYLFMLISPPCLCPRGRPLSSYPPDPSRVGCLVLWATPITLYEEVGWVGNH